MARSDSRDCRLQPPTPSGYNWMYLDWQETIVTMARADSNLRFTTLAHHLDPETLEVAYKALNPNASPGPDGVTMKDFGNALDANLDELWGEMLDGKYRASPARRVMIPKPNGKLRPLGIANVADRVVQRAIAMALEPIYEQDFLDFSYGFRPGRSAKGALEDLRKTIDKGWVRVVLDADIKGFFDNLDHAWLRKFLGHRVGDGGMMRLIGKVLKSGIVEDGVVKRSKKGAPQGGPLSPLLANVYLHYVLDIWFDRRFRRSCRGRVHMVRYADDFVVCLEYPEDAARLRDELAQRLAAFELELEPDKTHLIAFDPRMQQQGPGPKTKPQTFDFLGFTHFLKARSPKRPRRVTHRIPSRKSRTRFLAGIKLWLRQQMHSNPWFHAKVLTQKLRGFYAYFSLRRCGPYLDIVCALVERLWLRTLRRRSQRACRLTWKRIKRKPWFRLPRPKSTTWKKRKRKAVAVVATPKPQPTPSRQLCLFGT